MNTGLQEKYETKISQLRRDIVELHIDTRYSTLQKARASASLFHLLPNIDVEDHPQTLRKIDFYQCWAAQDQFHLDLLAPSTELTGEGRDRVICDAPKIICAFHYGSNRLILPLLLRSGQKISMLIDHRVADTQSSEFHSILHQYCATEQIPESNYKIRDTSSPSVLLSLIRDIRAGYSVLIFLDGNLSIGGAKGDRDHTVPVPFLGATLFSRAGLAVLSHVAKCPIVAMLAHRNPDCTSRNRVVAHEPIEAGDSDRSSYVPKVCAALWKTLQDALAADPIPWEPWRYVDNFLDLESLAKRQQRLPDNSQPPETIAFNTQRFALENSHVQYALLDRATYMIYNISAAFFNFLSLFYSNPRTRDFALTHPGMNAKLWKKLLDMGVLQGRL
jgi:hypothetical protein